MYGETCEENASDIRKEGQDAKTDWNQVNESRLDLL